MNIEDIFSKYKTIAVYGMSKQPSKAAHSVPAFMKIQGYNIIPINPTIDKILSLKSYSKLADIPETIDILNVFRPSADAFGIIKEAVERNKAKGDIRLIWLQEGIYSPEGKQLALDNNIDYIEDRCIYKEFVMHGMK